MKPGSLVPVISAGPIAGKLPSRPARVQAGRAAPCGRSVVPGYRVSERPGGRCSSPTMCRRLLLRLDVRGAHSLRGLSHVRRSTPTRERPYLSTQRGCTPRAPPVFTMPPAPSGARRQAFPRLLRPPSRLGLEYAEQADTGPPPKASSRNRHRHRAARKCALTCSLSKSSSSSELAACSPAGSVGAAPYFPTSPASAVCSEGGSGGEVHPAGRVVR